MKLMGIGRWRYLSDASTRRRIRGTRYEPSKCSQNARVAKSADAKDLKSFSWQRECGFKSHPGHHKIFKTPTFVGTGLEP
jgi:hypothetical protein